MGPNPTGKPRTSDYSLGRGIVYVALLSAAGKPIAWRDMGNAPEFTVTVEQETLEHLSSREGLKTVDKEVTISQTMNLSFSLDELNHENMADFFSGDKATHTNVAVAGFAEFLMVADGDLQLGRWYDIVNSSGNRAYDVLAARVTVKTNEAAPITLVLNTDYELDLEMGRIFILSTSAAAATAIAAVKGLLVTLAAEAGSDAVNEIRALTKSAVTVALKFIAENPVSGDAQTEYEFHQVTLKSEGDFSLIGEDWTQMGFTAKAEKNTIGYANSPTLTIRDVA